MLHALADDSGAVVEDVLEGLVLAVYIAHEVLGPLWQVEDGLKVYDLGERCLTGGEVLSEELEVAQVGVVGCALRGFLACHGPPIGNVVPLSGFSSEAEWF